jgi:phosphoesterase RecJ-like protein
MINYERAAALLQSHDKIRILTHQSPDGDTVGSAAGLALALQGMGKQVQILCSDPIPAKYDDILAPVMLQEFEPDLIVAVDVADAKLLGPKLTGFAGQTGLCVDHHASNTGWAQETLLEGHAGAACEVVYLLLKKMGAEITPAVAAALYTGLCTDTGCFRYSNTSPRTLRIAAELMEAGAPAAAINLKMFEIKTRSRLALERMVLDSLQYACGNRVAVAVISRQMLEASGAADGETEGVATLSRNIEGVSVGITLREKAPGDYKISVRADDTVDASELCRMLGGGGHARASGCRLSGTAEEVVNRMIAAASVFLEETV